MRLLLLGRGRMGRLVDDLSATHGFDVVARLDNSTNAGGKGIEEACRIGVDVAIDFSTAAAFVDSFPQLAESGLPVVVGTTGWTSAEPRLRRMAADAGIGIVAAANFSLGVNLCQAIVERAALLFAEHGDYDAWLHESHHAAKRDAPSGTALALKASLESAGYSRPIDVSCTRAGSIPGTHTVGFDGPFDSLTLTHTTRDRTAFARGALHAARWIHGKCGWFTMRDVLGLPTPTVPQDIPQPFEHPEVMRRPA